MDHMMKIEFLGTGTSTGIPQIGCKCEVCTSIDNKDKRLRTSALISVNNKNILIDCGPDFRQQILRTGVTSLDAVLITHAHYDHTAGFDDLRPFCNNRPVPIYLETSVAQAIRTRMPYCFTEKKYPGVPNLQLKEISIAPFSINGIQIIPIRAMHYKLPILGYRIGDMAYITDMLTLPEEEYQKLSGLKILVVNALRITEHISHQSLSQALNVIERVSPQKAYLIHMSHQMGLHEHVAPQLPDNVYLSYDGLTVEY